MRDLEIQAAATEMGLTPGGLAEALGVSLDRLLGADDDVYGRTKMLLAEYHHWRDSIIDRVKASGEVTTTVLCKWLGCGTWSWYQIMGRHEAVKPSRTENGRAGVSNKAAKQHYWNTQAVIDIFRYNSSMLEGITDRKRTGILSHAFIESMKEGGKLPIAV